MPAIHENSRPETICDDRGSPHGIVPIGEWIATRRETRLKTSRYDPHVTLPEFPDYSALPDEVLFDRIRRQDLVACSVYYARHGGALYGRLLAILGDEVVAKRALEEFFLGIWQRRRDLAKLGPAVTETLLRESEAMALAMLGDLPEDTIAAHPGRKALLARCRELGAPDLGDEAVRRLTAALLAEAKPVPAPPGIRNRLSLRLGHPDVDWATRRYVRRWPLHLAVIVLILLGLIASIVWLVLRPVV
ncbi:MAG: hypothetical protein JXQ73_05835 [Phycisphaerae bacterium]|nr:hypothetical protein [Phycisphaerae bacterium]